MRTRSRRGAVKSHPQNRGLLSQKGRWDAAETSLLVQIEHIRNTPTIHGQKWKDAMVAHYERKLEEFRLTRPKA